MKQISDNKPVNIDGYLFAVYDSRKVEDGQAVHPFLLRLEDVEFLPIFSTQEKLEAALEQAWTRMLRCKSSELILVLLSWNL